MRFSRSCGILLHPTSLPSRYGIGDLGEAAYQFVDFLAAAKQSLWQLLPLGPTGYGDSPYQCFSAFAGNPMLISPDKMAAAGYLPATAVTHVPNFPTHRVDYGPVIDYKNKLFDQAFVHFQGNSTAEQKAAFDQFCQDNAAWLGDFALFMALKMQYMPQEGGVWNTWPEDIARREPAAMAQWIDEKATEIDRHKFLQFVFFEQWLALKTYAHEHGIQIVGDAPIFVAYDSADVWANPDLFYLNDDGLPTVIAGVPPDYFSETGQRWGNPLYRWSVMAEDDYAWWQARLQAVLAQVDVVRLDHFRGFEAYWEIPAAEETAVVGEWIKGPGQDFFHVMQEKVGRHLPSGNLPIIAEDLGVITPEVEKLRDTFDFPGMKILQFAFGGEKNSNFLPHNFVHNSVVYTGTHDNETTIGWYQNASPSEQDHVRRYLASDGHDIAWELIRLAFSSVANMAVIPLQDHMKRDNSARMNFPGKASGYWQWRFTPGALTDEIRYRLAELTELYGRLPETGD